MVWKQCTAVRRRREGAARYIGCNSIGSPGRILSIAKPLKKRHISQVCHGIGTYSATSIGVTGSTPLATPDKRLVQGPTRRLKEGVMCDYLGMKRLVTACEWYY
ncbi:hypothetical protein E2C01_081206 [Portunus trituberculatus]|uniref:Uncharacterized protein n=1 Tax=Portunus trituberculatus TaxID=210409 RepID=A0A5B7ILL7_PORTR|nr:hypothetical protein [Portunus trituberculatus]